jgi:3',5'-cyclic AMP phosphodiesterase CpdA
VKIVHLTDLHVQCAPRWQDLLGKRLIGSTNLYLMGRKDHFSREVQEGAIRAALAETPDLVVITGDLTAQGLDSEFALAREMLDPLLTRGPAVIIAGNHDTYVSEARPAERMREVFSPWMGRQSPHLHLEAEVAFLCVETCRAHPLSSGLTPARELQDAAALLPQVGDRFLFLCLHYPLRGRRGEPYGPWTRALSNAAEVERWLLAQDRVGAVLHGHEHHGFTTTVPSGRGPIPIYNPGASGYNRDPVRDRTAHYTVYEADRCGISSIRRRRWNGSDFEPEPGEAWSSGR